MPTNAKTVEEILRLLGTSNVPDEYGKYTRFAEVDPTSIKIVQRQLYDLMLGVIGEVRLVNESNGRYNACNEMEAALRQLFGQPEEGK